jgi:hypothetical protein
MVIPVGTYPPIYWVFSIGSAAGAYVKHSPPLPIYYFMGWKGAKLPCNHLPMPGAYIELHTGKLNAVNIFLRKKETHTKKRKKLLFVGCYIIECINSRCIQLSPVILCIYAKM